MNEIADKVAAVVICFLFSTFDVLETTGIRVPSL